MNNLKHHLILPLLGLTFTLSFASVVFSIPKNEKISLTKEGSEDTFDVDKINSTKNKKLSVWFYDNLSNQSCDSFIITYGDTEILVDTGGLNAPFLIDKMASVVDSKTKIWDYVIFTHRDSDHVGNADSLLKLIDNHSITNNISKIGKIYDFVRKDNQDKDHTYFNLRRENLYGNDFIGVHDLLNDSNKTNDFITFGPKTKEAKLTWLYNEHAYDDSIIDSHPNNESVCFSIELGKQRLLFTGDLCEIDTSSTYLPFKGGGESLLIKNNKDVFNGNRFSFFKAGHHGSMSSNSQALIDQIRPYYCAITTPLGFNYNSKSANKLHYFPAKSTTDRLVDCGCKMYASDIAINAFDENGKAHCKGKEKLFGSMLFLFDGKSASNIDVVTEQVPNDEGSHYPSISLTNTDWFRFNRSDSIRVYTINENDRNTSHCTLVSYNNFDILIDCGSSSVGSFKLVDKIKQLASDGLIEYLIVTHVHPDSISQLVGTSTVEEENNGALLLNSGLGVGKIIDNQSVDEKEGTNDEQEKTKGSSIVERYQSSRRNRNIKLNDNGVTEIDFKSTYSRNINGYYYYNENNSSNDFKIHVRKAFDNNQSDENNNSLIGDISFNSKSVTFCGDLKTFNGVIPTVTNTDLLILPQAPDSNYSSEGFGDFIASNKPKYSVLSGTVLYDSNNFFDTNDLSRIRTIIKENSEDEVARNIYITGKLDKDNEYIKSNGDMIFSYPISGSSNGSRYKLPVKYLNLYSDNEIKSIDNNDIWKWKYNGSFVSCVKA